MRDICKFLKMLIIHRQSKGYKVVFVPFLSLFLTFYFLLLTFNCSAQGVAINTDGSSAAGSAILDVKSTVSPYQGVLLPRLTTAQRDAISSPVKSLLIFNTTTMCYEGYNDISSSWVAFGCIGCSVPTTVTAAANPSPVCAGSTLTLTGGATGATGWSWAGPNGFTSAAQSPTIAGITAVGAGVYTLAASNNCGSVSASTASVTVTALPVATFSYTGTPYCSNAANPSPTFSGGGVAGTFSSTAGLNFVSTATGQVNLSTSTAGTYTVTNTIAATGGCGVVTATSTITITTLPVATFSYTDTPYCLNAANPSPTYSGGGVAGTFSSTAGLNFVSTATGQVNITTSTLGTYAVTNTIATASGCGVVTATSTITISYVVVTGGDSYTSDATYYYRTFLASSTLGITGSLTCDVLVIAGGGGGGWQGAGGGGAGGVLLFSSQSFSTGQTVTVGVGGTGATSNATKGGNGTNSQFGSLTAVVGGGGGGTEAGGLSDGNSGGSGGGANRGGTGGGASPSGQGYAGGTGAYDIGGSGGGSGAAGGSRASGGAVPVGGVGVSSYSSWGAATSTGQNVSGTYYYAGGGGVGGYAYAATGSVVGGAGGFGGGGVGGPAAADQILHPQNDGTNGTANTGGGGGGGAAFAGYGGNGGSGIVIVRYTRAQVGG